MHAGLSDHLAGIGMADQHGRTVLQVQDALGEGAVSARDCSGFCTAVTVSPAFLRVGPYVELAPASFVTLWTTLQYSTYFGSFGLMQSFESPRDDFSDNEIERRDELADFLRIDEPAVDAQHLVVLRPESKAAHRGVGMRQGQVAALAEQQVPAQLLRESLIELERGVVEGDAFRRAVVGAKDCRIAAAVAASQVALLEHGHAPDPVLRSQVIGRGQAVHARAYDHRIVAGLDIVSAPHSFFLEQSQHLRLNLQQFVRPQPEERQAKFMARVRDGIPHPLAIFPAHEQTKSGKRADVLPQDHSVNVGHTGLPA